MSRAQVKDKVTIVSNGRRVSMCFSHFDAYIFPFVRIVVDYGMKNLFVDSYTIQSIRFTHFDFGPREFINLKFKPVVRLFVEISTGLNSDFIFASQSVFREKSWNSRTIN